MIDFSSKRTLGEFTRAEYLALVEMIGANSAPSEAEADKWIAHWDSVNPHPEKNGLMFWPVDGESKTTVEIVDEIERYCREQGLPCFRDSAP